MRERIAVLTFASIGLASCNSGMSQEQFDQVWAASKARGAREGAATIEMYKSQARYECIYVLKFADGSQQYASCYRDTLRVKLANHLERLKLKLAEDEKEVLANLARKNERHEIICRTELGETRCSY